MDVWWAEHFTALPTVVSPSKQLKFCKTIETMACFAIADPVCLVKTVPKNIVLFFLQLLWFLNLWLLLVLVYEFHFITLFLELSYVSITIHSKLHLLLLSIPCRVVWILARVCRHIPSDSIKSSLRRVGLHLEIWIWLAHLLHVGLVSVCLRKLDPNRFVLGPNKGIWSI